MSPDATQLSVVSVNVPGETRVVRSASPDRHERMPLRPYCGSPGSPQPLNGHALNAAAVGREDRDAAYPGGAGLENRRMSPRAPELHAGFQDDYHAFDGTGRLERNTAYLVIGVVWGGVESEGSGWKLDYSSTVCLDGRNRIIQRLRRYREPHHLDRPADECSRIYVIDRASGAYPQLVGR